MLELQQLDAGEVISEVDEVKEVTANCDLRPLGLERRIWTTRKHAVHTEGKPRRILKVAGSDKYLGRVNRLTIRTASKDY